MFYFATYRSLSSFALLYYQTGRYSCKRLEISGLETASSSSETAGGGYLV